MNLKSEEIEMKKLIVLMLAMVMVFCMCACGEAQVENTENSSAPETTAPIETTQPTETQESTKSAKELAMSCIDKSVDELIALIGEPNETDYVPSCLMEGEDGMLIYDDFVVYTYRLDGEETVIDVE